MTYVKVHESGDIQYPYSLDDLKKDNPQTSFPKNPQSLESWNVFEVTVAPKPAVVFNKIIEAEEKPSQVNGQWVLGWIVRDKNEDEILLDAESKRAARDRLLMESDWTQLADAPLTQEQKEAWAEYRQKLRDLPQQNGFPLSVSWPVAP